MCLVGWALTWRTAAELKYQYGKCLPPGSPGGDPEWWAFRATTIGFASFGGLVYVTWNEYPSLAPTRDLLEVWEERNGWQARRTFVGGPTARMWWRLESWKSFSVLGFGFDSDDIQGGPSRAVSVPCWVFIVAAMGPWLWALTPRRRRLQRIRAGRCTFCGYDRAGLGVGEVCPECGKDSGSR